MEREFKEEVLKEIYKNEDPSGSQISLRVVRWNNGTPKLEKRSFYRKKGTDEILPGKLVGLTAKDIEIIVEQKEEIMKYLEAH